MIKSRLPIYLVVAATLGVQLPVQMQTPARADVFEGQKLPYNLQGRQPAPIDFEKHTSGIEEFLKPATTGTTYVTPVTLHGVKIPGLASKTVDTLGFNNFVIVNDPKHTRMADLYRDNRLAGKANFVTTDCILHPYIAFTNRVLADSTENHFAPDLKHLLVAMLEQSAIDYNGTDDKEVREDIEKNIAFLGVAIKLLDPGFEMLNLGRVRTLVEHDLRNIHSGNKGISDIFDREEDMKRYRPVGWYKSSEKLANFYKAREWLSRMSFPISDINAGMSTNKSNSFRRSVLLFRALELGRVDGKPALDQWERIKKELALLAPEPLTYRDRVLYPTDYKTVFKNDANNLRDTLNGLSEPFYRTKLLLAVRRQKPVNLGSTSIFDMSGNSSAREASAVFRLFPITGDPEIEWMQSVARIYPSEQEGGTWFPVCLADLSAWGAPQAVNILAENPGTLDPGFNKTYGELFRSIVEKNSGDSKAIPSRRWMLFANYFRGFPDATQAALRGDLWLTHRLESAYAAWLASVTLIAPPAVSTATVGGVTAPLKAEVPPGAAATSTRAPVAHQASALGQAPASASGQAQQSHAQSAPPAQSAQPAAASAPGTPAAVKPRQGPTDYHVLEPDAAMFASIQADANQLMKALTELGYLQPYQKHRFADFVRLSARLQAIAEAQSTGRPMAPADKALLGNIDMVLDKVDVPLPTVLPFAGGTIDPQTRQHPGAGFNIALGRPGYLHVIVQNPRTGEWTLARGAVYSYYEFSGEPVSDIDWQRMLSNTQARPPAWTRQFNILQPRIPTEQTATKSATP